MRLGDARDVRTHVRGALLMVTVLMATAEAGPRWAPYAPARPDAFHVFATDEGVWRCTRESCELWSDKGKLATITPCGDELAEPVSWAVSPRGTYHARRCSDHIAITRLSDRHVWKYPVTGWPPLGTSVDDDGVVTLTDDRDGVLRVGEGKPVIKLTIQRESGRNGDYFTKDFSPANGEWLAFERGEKRTVGWRADGTTAVKVDGLHVALGARHLVFRTGTYFELTVTGTTALGKGPAPVVDELYLHPVDGAWGTTGVIVRERGAVVLYDRTLKRAARLASPGKSLKKLISDPSGSAVYAVDRDGAVRRWSGPLPKP